MKRLVVGVVVAGVLTVANPLQPSLTHASTYATAQQAAPAAAPSPSAIVATAKQYLGSPYATIGNTPAGFSCIGFVNFVFSQNGVNVPFDIPMAWNSAPHVAASDLMPGDVLFYSNTVFAGLSHVAIYIGNDQMIGADSFAVGVTTDRVSDAYWAEHYTGATRPLAVGGEVPTPASSTAATPTPVPTAAPVVASAPAGTVVRTRSGVVSMYSGPGYQYTPIGTLTSSTALTVVQGQGGWYGVRFGNTYGWINARDVEQVEPQVTAAVTQPTPVPTHTFSNAAATTSNAAGSVLYVAQGPLLIRSGPSKSFSSIGYVLVGTRLTVIELRPHWAHVTTSAGLSGWAALQYLSAAKPVHAAASVVKHVPAPPATTHAKGAIAKVVASVLNVRVQPDSQARILTVLFAGETVQIVSQKTGWAQVKLRNGTVGWASSAWLSTR